MTKKLKAKKFIDLLNEVRLDEVSELISLSYKAGLILGAGKAGENILLFIFSDLSILEIHKNKPDEALTFPLSKLKEYTLNLTPELRKTVVEIVDSAVCKAKQTKDDDDKKA